MYKTLTYPDLLLAGIGHVVGAGIFTLIGKAGAYTWLATLIAGLVVYGVSRSYININNKYEANNAEYQIIKDATAKIGISYVPTVTIWASIVGAVLTCYVVSQAFGGYFASSIGAPDANLLLTACMVRRPIEELVSQLQEAIRKYTDLPYVPIRAHNIRRYGYIGVNVPASIWTDMLSYINGTDKGTGVQPHATICAQPHVTVMHSSDPDLERWKALMDLCKEGQLVDINVHTLYRGTDIAIFSVDSSVAVYSGVPHITVFLPKGEKAVMSISYIKGDTLHKSTVSYSFTGKLHHIQ